jgi:hypothetical protein
MTTQSLSDARHRAATRSNPALIALLGGFVALAGVASAQPAQVGALAALPLRFVSAPIPMTIAGQVAELRVVRADADPQRALDAVAAVWTQESGLIRRDADGPWINLSRIDRDGLQALQLRLAAGGGSEGYLVGWRLGAAEDPATASGLSDAAGGASSPPGPSPHWLLPVGARVLSEVASNDAPRGRTLVAWVGAEIGEVDRAAALRARAAGLAEVRPESAPHASAATRPRSATQPVLGAQRNLATERSRHFSGGGNEFALTLHPQGSGTAIVVHQMASPR